MPATDPLPASPALTGRLRHLTRNAESEAREEYWRPDVVPYGAAQTFPRSGGPSDTNLASGLTGRLDLHGGVLLKPDFPVTSITFYAANTASVAPTNTWFCIVDKNLNVLRKTVDNTTNVWASQTPLTLALSSILIVTDIIPVYLGIVQVAGTVANLRGVTTTSGQAPHILTPPLNGASTTGLTDPASLGGTAVAPSALAGHAYAHIV